MKKILSLTGILILAVIVSSNANAAFSGMDDRQASFTTSTEYSVYDYSRSGHRYRDHSGTHRTNNHGGRRR